MLILGLVGLIGLCLLSTAFTKSPIGGAALALIVFTVETIFVELPPLPMGFNIFIPDIVFSLLFIAAAMRYLAGRARLTRARLVVLAMIFLFLLALARGAESFGIRQAGLASRSLFYIYAGTIYFSSFRFRRQQQRTIVNLWLCAAWVLIGLTVFRWIATAMGMEIAASWEDMETSPMRVLNAAQAMFLCVAFLFSCVLASERRATSAQKALVCLLPPVLILLQHRTVWIVLFVSLMSLFSKQTRALRKIVIAAVAALAVAIPLVFFLFSSSLVTQTLMSSATDPTTFVWRLAGWRQLLVDRKVAPIDYLVGQPAGTDESRVIGNTRVEANPHDFYVQTFLTQGAAGLFLLIYLYLSLRRGLHTPPPRNSRPPYLPYRAWALFLLAQMFFFVAYPPNYDQGLILGMAVAISSTLVPARKQLRPRPADRPRMTEGLA